MMKEKENVDCSQSLEVIGCGKGKKIIVSF